MSNHTIFLIDRQRKQYAIQCIHDAPENHVCIVKQKTRSLEQNRMLHKVLSYLSKTKDFGGKKRTIEEWKLIMVSGHAVATGQQSEMTLGIEGEVLNLRESTAKMSVKRLNSLIEYAMAWCADNDVRWEGEKY